MIAESRSLLTSWGSQYSSIGLVDTSPVRQVLHVPLQSPFADPDEKSFHLSHSGVKS